MKHFYICSFLIFVIFVLIASGCCKVVCSCNPLSRSIDLLYQNDISECNDGLQSLTQVAAYDIESGQLLNENARIDRFGCTIAIPYEQNKFWVATSDSLDISDTIKVENIDFSEDTDKCCDCPTLISTIEININGNAYFEKMIELSY